VSSAHRIADDIRAARANGRTLTIRGCGTWASDDAFPGAEWIETRQLAGIVDYVPGDLTLTCGAGTTLAEIADATAAHGQWCPLEPDGSDDVSIGAVLATDTRGPYSRGVGAPRDLTLGVQFVDGTGDVGRAGGRVVKNVAGFDLTRLLIGSWGALAVITEVSVRIRVRPRVTEHWVLRADPSHAGRAVALRAFEQRFAPLASHALTADRALSLGLAPGDHVVTLGGNSSHVAAGVVALAQIGDVAAAPPDIWTRHRALGRDDQDWAGERLLMAPLDVRVKSIFDPDGVLNQDVLSDVIV
jgi:glycolate oxidase FAD binding subunit